jgi:hypothetical protein
MTMLNSFDQGLRSSLGSCEMPGANRRRYRKIAAISAPETG